MKCIISKLYYYFLKEMTNPLRFNVVKLYLFRTNVQIKASKPGKYYIMETKWEQTKYSVYRLQCQIIKKRVLISSIKCLNIKTSGQKIGRILFLIVFKCLDTGQTVCFVLLIIIIGSICQSLLCWDNIHTHQLFSLIVHGVFPEWQILPRVCRYSLLSCNCCANSVINTSIVS